MEDNIAKKQLNRTKSTAQVLIVIICAIIAASIISGAAFDVTRILGRSMDDTLYGGKSVGCMTTPNTIPRTSTSYDRIPRSTFCFSDGRTRLAIRLFF